MTNNKNPFSDPDRSPPPEPRGPVDAENPYASPRVTSDLVTPEVGLWRDGIFMVVHQDVVFPQICLRTNEPARRGFRCHLSNPAGFFGRDVTLDVGLCESCIRRYAKIRKTGWTLIGMSVIISGLLIAGYLDMMSSLAFAGIVLSLFAGIRLASLPGVVLSLKRVRAPHYWIEGAHAGFLQRLPEWSESNERW